MNKNEYILQKGQSLFEVVVAVAISSFIITAVVATAANSIQNSSYAKDKTLASGYVDEAMEWLRKERDQNLEIFTSKIMNESYYCISNLEWPVTIGYCSEGQVINGTKFSRMLKVLFCEECDASVRRVEISVNWSDSKGEHIEKSTTDLSIK